MIKLPIGKKKVNSQADSSQKQYYIALDIGTEVLKGLLFSITDLGVEIWKSYSMPQQLHAMRSGVITNVNTVMENSKLVVNKLTEDLKPSEKPTYLSLGMAGELINGVSIVVDYDRENKGTRPLDAREEEEIKTKIFQEIIANGQEELAAKQDTTPDNISILHITITGLQVGGASVPSLQGYEGDSIRLHLYASFAPLNYLNDLKQIVNELGMKIGVVVAQPFAIASSFTRTGKSDLSAIFIDIGGGTSDVALVTNSNTIDTQMFAFGGRAFTKRIAKYANIDYRYAEKRKLKYSAGELDTELKDEIRRTLAADVKLWVRGLKIALESIEGVEQYPDQIYMCGGGALLPDIKSAILEYPWTKELLFNKIPTVNLLTPNRLNSVYDKTGTLTNPYDVTPAALARFYWDIVKSPSMHYIPEDIYKID